MKTTHLLPPLFVTLFFGCSRVADKDALEVRVKALEAKVQGLQNVLGVAESTSAAAQPATQQGNRSDKPDFVSAAQSFWREYSSNQVAFGTKYAGKTIELNEGHVDAVKSPNIVMLMMGNGYIYCAFDEPASLAAVKATDTISLSGVYDQSQQGGLVLIHCILK